MDPARSKLLPRCRKHNLARETGGRRRTYRKTIWDYGFEVATFCHSQSPGASEILVFLPHSNRFLLTLYMASSLHGSLQAQIY